MPYLEGGSLQDLLATRTLEPEEAVMVGRRIAGALQAAHRAGVVHRDVKPSNILLDGEGNPLLADFGVARRLDAATITQGVTPVGTAEYVAPELARGGEPSPASDLYALGATLYESLAGRPPFTGTDALAVLYQHRHEPVPPLPETVPGGLAGAIEKTL
ncbi:MAG: serine/threonine protein kinase, partial [Actinobacteria bacterium]|nr:serine/threonine protein kinase [Actinomycetota bacterium]